MLLSVLRTMNTVTLILEDGTGENVKDSNMIF